MHGLNCESKWSAATDLLEAPTPDGSPCCIFFLKRWLRRSLSLLFTAVLYSERILLMRSSKKADRRRVML